MLVLKRKCTQVVTIGDDIRVTVLEIRGDFVRLGIDAPPDTPVHRMEIWRKIQEQHGGGQCEQS